MRTIWMTTAVLAAVVAGGCSRSDEATQSSDAPPTGTLFAAATLEQLRAAGGATLQQSLDLAQQECGEAALGFEPGGVTSADLNGDGQADFLVDMTAVTCGGENQGGGWCGSLGCAFDIYVSTGTDFYQDSYIGSAPEIVRHGPGLGVGAQGRDGPFILSWNGTEMAVTPAVAQPMSAGDDAAQIRTVVGRIYDAYLDSATPGQAAPTELETTEFRQAIEASIDPEIGALEADYYCGCQDYGDVRYEIAAVRIEGRSAVASVDFYNFGGPAQRIDLMMKKVDDRWQVDDVRDSLGSLRESLAAG